VQGKAAVTAQIKRITWHCKKNMVLPCKERVEHESRGTDVGHCLGEEFLYRFAHASTSFILKRHRIAGLYVDSI